MKKSNPKQPGKDGGIKSNKKTPPMIDGLAKGGKKTKPGYKLK